MKGKTYSTLKSKGVRSYTLQMIFLRSDIDTKTRRLLETYLINTLKPCCNTFAASGLYADLGRLRQRATLGKYLYVYDKNGTHLTTLFSLPECLAVLGTNDRTFKAHMADKDANPNLLFRGYLLLERNPLPSAPAMFERNLDDPIRDQASLAAFKTFASSKYTDMAPGAPKEVYLGQLDTKELLYVFSSQEQT